MRTAAIYAANAVAPRWSDERIAALVQYRRRGWSASRISEALGTTRNAVLGKLHRLGMCKPYGRKRGRLAMLNSAEVLRQEDAL